MHYRPMVILRNEEDDDNNIRPRAVKKFLPTPMRAFHKILQRSVLESLALMSGSLK
jgi:hypothetical protein